MNDGDRTALRSMLAAKKFEPYISHIRFPHYKNLAADLRIDFEFPITALVGANGTNKSSILRAIRARPATKIWGCTGSPPAPIPLRKQAPGMLSSTVTIIQAQGRLSKC